MPKQNKNRIISGNIAVVRGIALTPVKARLCTY